jgi:radical SAM superfamily enzyme YgiQ (UPF0313 family)
MTSVLPLGAQHRRLPIVTGPTPSLIPMQRTRRHLCLVSLDWTRDKDPRVPLGHASLLAAVRSSDVADVTPFSVPINSADFSIERLQNDILRTIQDHAPQETDLGIGVYIWNDHLVQTLMKGLRKQGFTGRIVLGGPQISYSGAGLEKHYPEADAFIRGYGERALTALVSSPDHRPIAGVHWAGESDACDQARPPLASLPSPFLMKIIDVSSQRFLRWETQRGCVYRCSFCQHREPGERASKRERRLDLGRLREEIALFVASSVEDIAVLDPIFNSGSDYLSILAEFRRVNFRGRLSLQCRFESVDQEFLDVCDGLNVRLEFGLQTIHEVEGRAIRRFNKMDKVTKVLTELNRRRVRYEVSLIFGLPKQTLRSFLETVTFCLDYRVPTIRAFPLMLLRGTELEMQKADFGLVENQEIIPAVVRSNSFSEQDWHAMNAIATALDRSVGAHPTTLSSLISSLDKCPLRLSSVYSPARSSP